MSSRNGFQATDLALIAVFAALVAVLAVIPPMFMVGAVPFALQMVAVMLAPMVLGSCLLYTSPSPRDRTRSRMPSSA